MLGVRPISSHERFVNPRCTPPSSFSDYVHRVIIGSPKGIKKEIHSLIRNVSFVCALVILLLKAVPASVSCWLSVAVADIEQEKVKEEKKLRNCANQKQNDEERPISKADEKDIQCPRAM